MTNTEERKLHEKKVNDMIHSIGLSNNLGDAEVKKILESQFRFTYEIIVGLSFDNLTDEEIENMKTNFYYKKLGKLYTNAEVIRRYKNRDNYLKQLKEDGRS